MRLASIFLPSLFAFLLLGQSVCVRVPEVSRSPKEQGKTVCSHELVSARHCNSVCLPVSNCFVVDTEALR